MHFLLYFLLGIHLYLDMTKTLRHCGCGGVVSNPVKAVQEHEERVTSCLLESVLPKRLDKKNEKRVSRHVKQMSGGGVPPSLHVEGRKPRRVDGGMYRVVYLRACGPHA